MHNNRMIKSHSILLAALLSISTLAYAQTPEKEVIKIPAKSAKAAKAAKKAKAAQAAQAAQAAKQAEVLPTPESTGPMTNEPIAAPSPAVPDATPALATPATAAEVVAAPVKEEMPAEKPVAESASKEKVYDYGKTNRPLGDFLVGPYVQALGLLRPFGGGLELKYADLIGLSGNYTFLPELKISSVKLKVSGWDARVKVYPFKGAFFLGLAYGSQDFTGSMNQTYSGINGTVTVHQKNNFITPHIGWNWIFGSGFFMGMDLGVQLSMNQKTDTSTDITNGAVLNSAEYQKTVKDINDKANLVGKTPLPLLTLLKFGYLF